MNSGGRPSAVGSGPWTSYTMSASASSSVCVVVMAVRPLRGRKLIGPGRPGRRGEEGGHVDERSVPADADVVGRLRRRLVEVALLRRKAAQARVGREARVLLRRVPARRPRRRLDGRSGGSAGGEPRSGRPTPVAGEVVVRVRPAAGRAVIVGCPRLPVTAARHRRPASRPRGRRDRGPGTGPEPRRRSPRPRAWARPAGTPVGCTAPTAGPRPPGYGGVGSGGGVARLADDLDGAALAVLGDLPGDTAHEPPGRFVADDHHGGETIDPDRPRSRREALDERGPHPAPLPPVRHGARELGPRRGRRPRARSAPRRRTPRSSDRGPRAPRATRGRRRSAR